MNKEQKIVAVLSIVVYLVMVGVTIISPILPKYAKTFETDLFLVGFLVGSFALARVFLGLPAGIFGDRFGNRLIMSIGLIVISLSSLVAFIAFDYYVLLVARVLEGAGSAFFATMSISYLARNTRIERRGRYMSVYVGMLLLGQVSGPGIGGVVADRFGLNAPFLFYALASALGLLILLVFIRKDKPRDRQTNVQIGEDIRRLFANRSFILVNIGTLSVFFGRIGIIAALFPLMAELNFGLDPPMIGLILTGVALMSLITMVPSGLLADKVGRKIPFTASLVLGGISILLVPLAWDLTSLVLAMLFFGLTLGLSGPMAAWAADLAPRKAMGTAMGVYRTIGDAGFLLGPTVLTAIASFYSSTWITIYPFIVCSVWLVITGILLLRAEDPAGRKITRAPMM